MKAFYSLGIFCYGALIRFASLFIIKARLWVHGRKNLFENLREAVSKDSSPIIWFHCASLGEFEQGRPLMERIRKDFPGYRILLSFFSPSGYEVRKKYAGADIITYLPLDTRANAKRFLDIVNPAAVVFVKYEFWLNHLEEIHRRNIPHYLIAAIFRNDQVFFKGHGEIFRTALKNYTHIFTQDENSLALIHTIGVKNSSVAGDTRFDRVAEIAATAKPIPVAETIALNGNVIVAGSTWKTDEDHLFPALKKHFTSGWKMIIAPHEISPFRIEQVETALIANGVKSSGIYRYSRLVETMGEPECQVLIIDNIGMLSSLYRYGNVAYIGGGFGKSIHNTLEAAVYGIPVVFGPMYGKFNEALGLIQCKGGFGVHTATELQSILDALLTDQAYRKESGKLAGDFVKSNVGATEKILAKLDFLNR
ncbi:MAG TPA: glycosyltransferase N-terminal domain-containing protein [Bacteroidia bacterium]|nr:glycosyltransferase N-terminal domain-containing protein [Bacteroidia bacterium]